MKKRVILGTVSVALATAIATGAYVGKSMAEKELAPFVREQLNNAIHGTVQYEAFGIGWNGRISLSNLSVKDRHSKEVIHAEQVNIGLSPMGVLRVLIGTKDSTAAIGNITIERPIIVAKEDANKNWNLSELLKKSDASAPMDYEGVVTIEDGTVVVENAKGASLQVESLQGVFKFEEYPTLKGALTANIAGEGVTVTGTYALKGDTDFDVFFKTDALNMLVLKDFISLPKELEWQTATLKDTAVHFVRRGGHFRMAGRVHADQIAFSYQNKKISKGSADLELEGSLIKIRRSDMRLEDQLVTASGTIDISSTEYPIHGTVTIPEARLESIFPDHDIEGKIKATAIVDGSLKNIVVDGHIEGKNIRFHSQHVRKVAADYSYDHGVISITQAKLEGNEGEAVGHGIYDREREQFDGYVEAKNIEVAPFATAVGEDFSGSITGRAFVKGKKGEVTSLTSQLEGSNMVYHGIGISKATLSITGERSNYRVHYAHLQVGEGEVTARGTISSQAVQLEGTLRKVPTSTVNSFFEESLEGSVDGTFKVWGDKHDPQGEFTLFSTMGSVQGFSYDTALIKGNFGNEVLSIEEGRIQAKQGIYSVQGTIGYGSNEQLAITSFIEKARIEDIAKQVTDIPITGWVSGNAIISGTRTNPAIKGEAHLWEGSLYGELISSASVQWELLDHKWNIPFMNLKGYDSELRGKGIIDGNRLDIVIGGDNLKLHRIFRNQQYAVKGIATVVGTLTGTVDNPVFKGQVGASRLSINDVELEGLGGEVYIDKKVIYAEKARFNESGGNYQLSGGVRLDSKEIIGNIQIQKGNIGNIIQLFKLPVQQYTGDLYGDITLGGTIENPRVDVYGHIEEAAIAGKLQERAEIDASFADKALHIRKLRVPLGTGFLAMAGKADLEGTMKMQVVANEVPIEALIALTGKDIPLTGVMNGVINGGGKTENPDLQASFEIANPIYNGVHMDSVYGLFSMKDKKIRLHQFLMKRGPYKGTVYGEIALAALLPKGKETEERTVDLKANLSEAGLGVLPLLTPAVTSADGPVKGIIEITGPLDNLEARGSLVIENGSVQLRDIAKSLTNIHGNLQLNGQKGSMSIAGTMGKGNAMVTGEADWTGGILKKYAFSAVSKGMEINSKYFKGPLDGDISITSGDRLPKIAGNIYLHDALIDIPLSFTSSEGSQDAILDVEVVAGPNVRLYNPLLYDLRVSGRAHYNWQLSYPRAEGTFVADKGYVKYLNNRFKIEKGEATYNDIGTFLPNLSVKANADVKHYNIQLDLQGLPTALQLKLTSEPYLTETQIVSLLTLKTTGKNISGLDQRNVSNLVSAGLEMAVFGPVENLLQQQLNLDLVRITSTSLDPHSTTAKLKKGAFGPEHSELGMPNDYYSLEVGRYIMPNLMVTYGTGLNYSLSKVGVSYDLGRDFNLNAWYTTEKNYYVGGQWQYRF